MASKSRIGKRVRIAGGMKEFVGKTGEISAVEGNLYRVELDEAVRIPGLQYSVRDDLWAGEYLKTIR